MGDIIYGRLRGSKCATAFFSNHQTMFVFCKTYVLSISPLCSFFCEPCTAWCQFHQHFMRGFFVQKFCPQLFCTYILGLYFFGARMLAQKLLIKCWWNWHLGTLLLLIVRCGSPRNCFENLLRVSTNLIHEIKPFFSKIIIIFLWQKPVLKWEMKFM